MSRTQRTASLFTALQAPLPQSLPPRLPPAPPTPQLRGARTAELWAAVQWPPGQFATDPAAQLAQQALLAQRFTPRVSLEPPDALLLALQLLVQRALPALGWQWGWGCGVCVGGGAA